MRREEYEIFMKHDLVGLLKDCVYYCFQTEQITDDEYLLLDRLCLDFFKFRNKGDL